MPSPDTRVVTAHVPNPLAAKVDEIALRLERSRGWVIKQALADWVAREEERHLLTLEGLVDIDAGRVIDHDDVEAWAARLGSADPLPLPDVR
jgi:predicted transcriptional regulator